MDDKAFEVILRQKQGKIDKALEQMLSSEKLRPEIIHKAMRYSVLGGGKRIRPILCLASFEAVGGNEDLAIPVACALELIHTYSLVHDDLPCMDNDDFRRGRPTNHKVFGEAMAVLAGDALLTLSFEWIAGALGISPEIKIKVIQEIANASGTRGMVGGQVADLIAEGQSTDAEKVQFIHAHKTARLIEASVKTGALLGGVSSDDLRSMALYGFHLGLAFQIVDDLLDVLGNAEQMGKAVRKDAQLAKATYPGVFGIEDSKKMAKEHIEKALAALEFLGAQGEFLSMIAELIQKRQN